MLPPCIVLHIIVTMHCAQGVINGKLYQERFTPSTCGGRVRQVATGLRPSVCQQGRRQPGCDESAGGVNPALSPLPPCSPPPASGAAVSQITKYTVWWRTVRFPSASTPCTSRNSAALSANTVRLLPSLCNDLHYTQWPALSFTS